MSRETWLKELMLRAYYLKQALDLAQDRPADNSLLERAQDLASSISTDLQKMRDIDSEVVVLINIRSDSYPN